MLLAVSAAFWRRSRREGFCSLLHRCYRYAGLSSCSPLLGIIDKEILKKLSPSVSNPDPRDMFSRQQEEKEEDLETLPIIHVKATYNNTIISITDYMGQVKAWTSAGAEGFRNARRGTTFAAQSAGVSAAKKALELNYERVAVKLKGLGPGRQSSLKGLEMGGVSVVSIQDVTPIPHNGCRPKKARRL